MANHEQASAGARARRTAATWKARADQDLSSE